MKQYCMDAAQQVRELSNCTTKVGAVLERGGRILAVAPNSQGSMKHGGYLYSRHAEGSVLLNKNARGGSVYVYRSHQQTEAPLLAKPCDRCAQRLRDAGVKKVFYSTVAGWEEMKL